MPVPANFDWKNPDYLPVFQKRLEVISRIRANPAQLPFLKTYYKDHIAQFISDFGCTVDPKLVERGLPATIPFILYPKQEEWVEWVLDHWHNQRPGLTEKTRQTGASWLSMAVACSICLFHNGAIVGLGSRKQDYVDIIGDPKSLIEKGRLFMKNLPREFRGGWDIKVNAPHMRLSFPETGALIAGESGDQIGRGSSTSLFFVDEAAFLEHPMLVEGSLSQSTSCRIDISTPNGLGNAFAIKRFSDKIDVFAIRWQDDPRKDIDWYAKQVAELDPVTLAQEVDISYAASVEGVLIPNAWVMAAMDAHITLGITPTGNRGGALDVADEGRDANAFCGAHGILIEYLEEWSGKGADIFDSVVKTFGICDVNGYREFRYDADGLGAGVRGDARIINEGRSIPLTVIPFRGSGPVHDPEGENVKGRKNQDFFANAKAQSWWSLRTRFQKTHRWVTEGESCNKDDIISIPKGMANATKLMSELSRPTFTVNQVGKIVIDKAPDGTKSPNCFVAGTMVMTPDGEVPIEVIVEGDIVETPFGRSKVIKAWVSETKALTSLSLSSGSTLTGTPNHNIFVWRKGKVPLDTVLISYTLEPFRKWRLSWQVVQLLFIRVKNSGFANVVDITTLAIGQSPALSGFFIAAFGLTSTGLSRRIMTFITEMMMGVITILSTWSAFSVSSTIECTCSNGTLPLKDMQAPSRVWKRVGRQLRHGTALLKDWLGIQRTAGILWNVENLLQKFVRNVVLSSRHFGQTRSSVVISAGSVPGTNRIDASNESVFGAVYHFVLGKLIRRAVVVNDVQHLSVSKTNVYNLTLERDNAYYANGVLVFNCADAVMIRFCVGHRPMRISDEALLRLGIRR